MKRFKRLFLFALSLILIFSLTGCMRRGSDGTKIRIAYFPNITHSQALIGSSNGTFEKHFEGYGVEYYNFNAGPAEIEAMFAGQIDVGYIGPVPAVSGYSRSYGDILIASGCSNGGAVLVASEGVEISSVADLAGKKVAIPQLGNTQHLLLLKLLAENGLSTTTEGGTVDLYAVANSEIKSLMANGELDAALVPEPWGARLINEVNASLVLDYDQLWLDGNYSTAVVIVHRDFLEDYPHLVERFLAAHNELTEYINQNPDEAMKIANQKILELTGTAFEDDVLAEAFSRIVFTTEHAHKSIEEFITLSMSEGFIDPFDFEANLFLE